MFLIRWFIYLNILIPGIFLFPVKKIFLRKNMREKHKGPVIICMNHTAFLDYIEALLAFPFKRIYVLVGKQFYGYNKFLSFCLKVLGVIVVDEVTGNMDAVNKAVDQINKGHSILVFPEGHIETEGKLLEYKQAAALISLSSGAPVLPVFHNGRIGPGKRDLMFIGSLMYPDSYVIRDDLENLQDRAAAFTKDVQDRTEEFRHFYLKNFMIADGKKRRHPKYAGFIYNFIRFTAFPPLKLGYRMKVSYGGDLARGTRYMEKGMIIASNHSWWLDMPFLYVVFFRAYCRCLVAKDISEMSSFRAKVLCSVGVILFDRTDFDFNALKTLMNSLKNDEPLIIFPEGHLNYDDELLKFKKGMALLALYANVPVVPVYIHSSYRLFKPARFVIGDPIEFDKAGLKTDNESIEKANSMISESLYSLKRQAILETKPELNRYIKKRRAEMKVNLAEINARNVADLKAKKENKKN